ncbi:hypothetical protein RYX56_04760 [Alkalihalophilus lindianensis]|uniref:Uncharacterized protein n=1 Tax=Alkalihalophilus lindianensis TaxID=1630542 RepID=A0ABU3X720_9BACI|nr:hypothetical protein [Alkalihalophilus lindianensis]MDV2683686.1 hypothetical protein [Alkalihalophilus lindianensis]
MNQRTYPSLFSSIKKPSTAFEWFTAFLFIVLFIVGLFSAFAFRLFVMLFLVGLLLQVNRFLQMRLNGKGTIAEEAEIAAVKTKPVAVPTPIKEETDQEILEKTTQLQKIDFDRTELLEELFRKASLDDEEKQTYRSKIKQKDHEISRLRQELMNAGEKIQQVMLDTKNMFVKHDPMKELASSIDSELLEADSLDLLNEHLQRKRATLTEEDLIALNKAGYVDEEFKLTRAGFKALTRAVEK